MNNRPKSYTGAWPPTGCILMLHWTYKDASTGPLVEDRHVIEEVRKMYGLPAPTDPLGWGVWSVDGYDPCSPTDIQPDTPTVEAAMGEAFGALEEAEKAVDSAMHLVRTFRDRMIG